MIQWINFDLIRKSNLSSY